MKPTAVQGRTAPWLPRVLLPLALLAWALAMFAAFIVALPVPVELRGRVVPAHLAYGVAVLILAWVLAVAATLGVGFSIWKQGASKSGVLALLLVVLLAAASGMNVIGTWSVFEIVNIG